jgi:hypothetical protein
MQSVRTGRQLSTTEMKFLDYYETNMGKNLRQGLQAKI